MEARRFIHSISANQRPFCVTQVVTLPKDAAEFLDLFWGIFRRTLFAHCRRFMSMDSPRPRINMVLDEKVEDMEMHKVLLVASRKMGAMCIIHPTKNGSLCKPLT